MNIEDLLIATFRDENEEVMAAQEQLVNIQPDETVIISLLNLISDDHKDILLRTAASIRLKQILLYKWEEINGNERIYEILRNWLYSVLQTNIFVIISSIYDISQIIVQNLYFRGRWPDLLNLILSEQNSTTRALILAKSMFSHYRYQPLSDLDPNFINYFLSITTNSLENISILEKTLAIRCVSYLSIGDLPQFFKQNLVELNKWITMASSITMDKSNENLAYIHHSLKFYSLICHHREFITTEQRILLLNETIEIAQSINTTIILKYAFKFIEELMRSIDIYSFVSLEEITSNFILPSFALTKYDAALSINYPHEFVLSNFVFDPEIYDTKNLAAELSYKISKSLTNYTPMVFEMCVQLLSSENVNEIIIALSALSTVIRNICENQELVLNLIESSSNFMESDNEFIRAAYFSFLAYLKNIEVDPEIIEICLNHINDEFIFVRFYALSAFCSLLSNSSLETIKGFNEAFSDSLDDIMELFIEDLSLFGSIRMLSNTKTLLNVFRENLCPYLEALCNGVLEMVSDILINEIYDLEIISDAVNAACDIIDIISSMDIDNTELFFSFLQPLIDVMLSLDIENQGSAIDLIEHILSRISTLPNEILPIITPVFMIQEEQNFFNIEYIVPLTRTILIRQKIGNCLDGNLLTFLFNLTQNLEDNDTIIKILSAILFSIEETGLLPQAYEFALNNVQHWIECVGIGDLLSALILYNCEATLQVLMSIDSELILILSNAGLMRLIEITYPSDMTLNLLLTLAENIKEESQKFENENYLDFPKNEISFVASKLMQFLNRLSAENTPLYEEFNTRTFPFIKETLPQYIM